MDSEIKIEVEQEREEAENALRMLLEQFKRDEDVRPDYEHSCENCGATPVVPCTGMCGPCTFGEADTAHGNW